MQYVLAMLLPSNMPWSEEEPGVSFWDWFAKVFSPDDSWELWGFLDGDVPLVQEQEYVTAYPTKANSLAPVDEALERLRQAPAAQHVYLSPERLRQADPPERAYEGGPHATSDLPEVPDP